MAHLSLTLLGGFRARIDGNILPIAIRKSQALLAYLALPLGQARKRDELAALLWGDMRPPQARTRLRQTLFALRKELGHPEPLQLIGDTVALDASLVSADVEAFERCVARGSRPALAEAAALYQGELLDGLALDARAFQDWLDAERSRLRDVVLTALATLLAEHRKAGALAEAVQASVRLIALDPLQEPVHRALMELYTQLGRRAAALRQYQLCVALLRRELGAEPAGETRALYQKILQRSAMAPSPPPPATSPAEPGAPVELSSRETPAEEAPLVGREVEWAELRRALETSLAGVGRLVAVTGEAGIGKSRLVAEVVAEAGRRGARVLLARCYETEQVLPFGPWIGALRASDLTADAEMLEQIGPAARAALQRLLPEIAVGAAPSRATFDQAQLFEAVAQLLERAVTARPALLVFEDLHWADETSLRLLAFVGRRLERWPMLAIAIARDEDLPDAASLRHILDEVERAGRLRRLALGALSRHHTLALARTLGPPAAISRVEEQLWAASRGNPFIVVETLRALGGDPAIAETGALPLAEGVRELTARRVERLGERSQRLLAVAAVIGRPFDFALLQRASDLGEAEAAETVEELVRRRLLHASGDDLEFTHDRVRDVVYGQLGPARRALLHRRVAEALESPHAGALEPDPLALGAHYREAAVWTKAARYLGRAGDVAGLRAALPAAASCYEEALAALAHLPESRETSEHGAELRSSLAQALLLTGQFARAREHYLLAEGLAVSLDDRGRQAQIYTGMAYLLVFEGELEAAVQSGHRALTLATAVGDHLLEVWSSAGLGRAYFGRGDYRAAIDRFRWVIGAVKDAPADLRLAGGAPTPAIICRASLGLCLGYTGEYSEAIAWAGEGRRLAEAANGPVERLWTSYCLGCIYLERGDVELAAPLLEHAAALCAEGRVSLYAPRVLAALGACRAMEGDAEAARRILDQALVEPGASHLGYRHSLVLLHAGEAHLAAGRLDEAPRDAAQALDLARRQGARGDEARALHLEADIRSRTHPSESERALERYAAALALATELGMAPLQARCHLGIGGAHRRAGREELARGALALAAAMLETMEMWRWMPSRDARLDDRVVSPS
jgi:DNA-binding SARP family transcriptional activator